MIALFTGWLVCSLIVGASEGLVSSDWIVSSYNFGASKSWRRPWFCTNVHLDENNSYYGKWTFDLSKIRCSQNDIFGKNWQCLVKMVIFKWKLLFLGQNLGGTLTLNQETRFPSQKRQFQNLPDKFANIMFLLYSSFPLDLY